MSLERIAPPLFFQPFYVSLWMMRIAENSARSQQKIMAADQIEAAALREKTGQINLYLISGKGRIVDISLRTRKIMKFAGGSWHS